MAGEGVRSGIFSGCGRVAPDVRDCNAGCRGSRFIEKLQANVSLRGFKYVCEKILKRPKKSVWLPEGHCSSTALVADWAPRPGGETERPKPGLFPEAHFLVTLSAAVVGSSTGHSNLFSM